MNGTLRGLSTLSDIHIPSIYNPPQSRHTQAPLPLDFVEATYLNDHERLQSSPAGNEEDSHSRYNKHMKVDALRSQEGPKESPNKKPHLAISELVEPPADGEHSQVQLPSFVSLSVVEKSPTQGRTQINFNRDHPHKRPRLDADPEHSLEPNRLLPKPVQKDGKQIMPLLPAMVTGLNEPPPSAALLPSIHLEARPALQRSATTTSKMQVKDMLLLRSDKASNSRPPEQMLNTPEVVAAELPKTTLDTEALSTDTDTPTSTTASTTPVLHFGKKDPKVRRTRRKWTEAETKDLLAGVRKHGFGKWKQILNDVDYTFIERTSIDLKDRYRVFAKENPDVQSEVVAGNGVPTETTRTNAEANVLSMSNINASSNKPRRKRHPWTKEEDAALLQGVQKYGFQWTDIHNDEDLGLGHRRATDLRDRIRNLYPDGYRHAEARPLRAELKKAEKAGKKETPAGTLYAPPGHLDSIVFSGGTAPSIPNGRTTASRPSSATNLSATGKVPSIATLTKSSDSSESMLTSRGAPRRSKTIAEPEHAGITLPSIALDNSNDTDDWDNTLPPFMNWEHEI